jgi:tetratricopeptide (TPR) repeat protein
MRLERYPWEKKNCGPAIFSIARKKNVKKTCKRFPENPLMSRPIKSDREKPEYYDAFLERIDLLFEELSFAIQWQRPSILLIFYESEYIREKASLALEKRLAEIRQQVMQIRVDERNFDIPLLLSQRPDRDQSVYSVSGFSLGGGKAGANAYRALNMRREYFVDYAIRVILWLVGDEAIELSRHAPDFWAFRHRVVEFNDFLDQEHPVSSTNKLLKRGRELRGQPEDLDEQIKMHEALIKKRQKPAAPYPIRLNLLSALAALYQAKQEYDQAIRRLKQGILIARKVNDTATLAKFWVNLGDIYLGLLQPTRAIRAYRKAIRLNPQDAESWIALGHVYDTDKRITNAIIAYKQALLLDPQNSQAKSKLVACYRLSGRDDLGEKRKKIE